ncbi:hypothetical protein [Gemmatimonas sp.]|uniref:hypothetical protein n=1 Tax=Gemmatimonas sp. TaxID=1962908 RepID=UPI003342BFF7
MSQKAIPYRAPRMAALLTLCAGLAACEQPVAEWVDPSPVATGMPSPLAHPPFIPYDSTLREGTAEAQFLLTQDQLRELGAVTLLAGALDSLSASRASLSAVASLPPMQMAPAPAASLGDGDTPADSLRCARSLRLAIAVGRGRVATWWRRAPGGRVHLVAAWRDTIPAESRLGPWRGPIMVDTLDQGPRDAQASDRGAYGCARPAPSLAVDSLNGYVHVAYALTGPEGPGVFYAHQMDPRAGFEPPVAVLYGERLGEARVASHGELVAVAYEDPNSRGRVITSVAISRTAGHLFEERLAASGGTTARDPYVAVRGKAVVVGWSDFGTATAEPVFTIRRAILR